MTDEEINRKFDVVANHLATLAVSQQRGEERISRVERMLLLAIRAGQRERREWRERHVTLVEAQVHTEEKVSRLVEAQTRTEEALKQLAQSQAHTDSRLDVLIDIVREGRNGKTE